jgi:cellulose synthase/poly-beta-1,6-N-acetylglucosamine synthase-like glycosyltransferase
MKDLITIIIPCKNESSIISETLYYLNRQVYIDGVKVLIADSSDDNTRDVIRDVVYENIDIEIIDGGIPSVARNNGAKLSKTPYVLFLDADIFLHDFFTIFDTLIICDEYDLITCKFRTNGKYRFVFPIFEFIRDLFIWYSPCAIGGFMLFNKSVFDELGGFNEKFLVAEDYALSNKINPCRFKVSDHKIYTTDRRFRNKGLWYMTKLMFKSIINKNNPKFFEDSHGYWI